ncbi:hypothetical protein PYW07_013969 [Mythimna separata]|uniref:Uncharacterized protein n=1 Tax=Mythimna separata TaxID=271217 RepID=A0AAD8DQF7_MYTSE|nr:hypothetical protein PYW07_013969 [Mythimna separata]
MIILIFSLIYTVQLIVHCCNGLHLIDLPQNPEAYYRPKYKLGSRAQDIYEPYPRTKGKKLHLRRYWPGPERPGYNTNFKRIRRVYEDEKDATLKQKIATLVKQTMSEAEEKMKDVIKIKEQYRKEKKYRAGFIISMVKKSRDVLNELFNVAVKHRDEWLALEQLKIFELIVHTNIDTTNFLKQLVEIEEGRDAFEIPDSFKVQKPTDNIADKPKESPTHKDKTPSDPSDSSDPNKTPSDPSDISDPNKTPSDPSDPSDSNKTPQESSDPSDTNKTPADPSDSNKTPADPSDSNKTPADPSDSNKTPSDPDKTPPEPSDPDKTPPKPSDLELMF